jgi:thimet oligopeptidase
LDLYPRDGKYGHAAVFPLVKRAIVSNSVVLPVCAMVCNFNKANSEEEDSLMSFDEVETFFHEFGHIMHNICSEATFAKFSGTSVERDFVELPS